MKIFFNVFLIPFVFFIMSSQAWCFYSENTATPAVDISPDDKKNLHDEWLKARFSKQHQALIPVVAVADMYLVCNQTRKVDDKDYTLNFLINEMDRNTLAEKLSNCLGEDNVKSNAALNFGLLACFQSQLSHLPNTEKAQKMTLVKQAIASLSLKEREKSFTQCVTEQSVHYLK